MVLSLKNIKHWPNVVWRYGATVGAIITQTVFPIAEKPCEQLVPLSDNMYLRPEQPKPYAPRRSTWRTNYNSSSSHQES